MTDTLTDEVTEISETESTPNEDGTNPEDSGESTENTEGKARDFTKTRELHDELAAYVNEHSGLDPVSAAQIFAVTTLRGDFNKLPEQVAKREARKAELAAEAAKYEGLSPEQIKATKVADRAERSAALATQKAQEALEKAQRLRAQASGSAAELAAAVEAQTADEPVAEVASEPEVGEEVIEDKPKRGLRRR